jgi:hypothetical protein
MVTVATQKVTARRSTTINSLGLTTQQLLTALALQQAVHSWHRAI